MSDTLPVISSVVPNPDMVLSFMAPAYEDLTEEFKAAFWGSIDYKDGGGEGDVMRVRPANHVDNATMIMPSAASHRDLTKTTPTDGGAAPATYHRRMPVQSNVVGPLMFTAAFCAGLNKTVEETAQIIGNGMAERIFNARKLALYNALYGALTAATTVTHVRTHTAAAVAQDVLLTRALLQDHEMSLGTIIMHPKVYASIRADMAQGTVMNEKSFGSMVYVEGAIPALVGMRIFVDSQVPTVSLSGGTGYCTFLLGPKCCNIVGAPDRPLFGAQNIVNDGVALKISLEDDFAVGVEYMDYSQAATNPANAALATSGNWAEAFSHDHRNLKVAMLVSIQT